jgi:PIN domain nuclease of toxin-antitoxin system
MRAILDTHTFLWWITDSDELSQKAREIIADAQNELFVSAASTWEIAIKAQLGRLEFVGDPERVIPEQLSLNAVEGLPVQISHALHVYHLPQHHRDPFDHLLIAQARLEEIPIITKDPVISQYDVETIW